MRSSQPELCRGAEKFGANRTRMEKAGDLRAALSEALHADKPSVVEIMIDSNELTPPARKDIMEAAT